MQDTKPRSSSCLCSPWPDCHASPRASGGRPRCISCSRLRIAASIGLCTSGRKRHFHTNVGNSRITSGCSIQRGSFSAAMVRSYTRARAHDVRSHAKYRSCPKQGWLATGWAVCVRIFALGPFFVAQRAPGQHAGSRLGAWLTYCSRQPRFPPSTSGWHEVPAVKRSGVPALLVTRSCPRRARSGTVRRQAH